jgi:hypothetical protein
MRTSAVGTCRPDPCQFPRFYVAWRYLIFSRLSRPGIAAHVSRCIKFFRDDFFRPRTSIKILANHLDNRSFTWLVGTFFITPGRVLRSIVRL